MNNINFSVNGPTWNRILINRQLPKRLKALDEIAKNLWWCWNQNAIDLFRSINPQLWEDVNRNPLAMLDRLTLNRYKELEKNSSFLVKLDSVYVEFTSYMKGKNHKNGPSIGYLCMEYGLDTSLKIYSGGLGILAGDYIKEASDMQVNMTAVGLLYKFGYFTQYLSSQGEQVSHYDAQDFSKTPVSPVRNADGSWFTISIPLPGRDLKARVWKAEVGRTDLYLLDTDFEENWSEDRGITHQLYGGDWDNRMKQEILLGIGGVKVLKGLGINPQIYHCNEGHAAFMGIERIKGYIEEGLSYAEALEVVRSSSLFTTHTPVPAGHDAFSEDMMRTYFSNYLDYLKVDWPTFMHLGKVNVSDHNEKFSMSVLASHVSQETNGVSWLHGKVSQKLLAHIWPGYLPEENHVGYVTNGVHYPTWTAPEWKEIHDEVFGEEFKTHHYDLKCFEGIYKVSDEKVWSVRNSLRKKLIDKVKLVLSDTSATSHYSPQQIVKIKRTLRSDILTIGFARRFATYKRALLLFKDLERLDQIVNNPEHPVQFLFAGKAHPADKLGQDFIKRIVEISKMPKFIGKVVFVPNYDITIAKYLVQGVDIWMNNPTRPLEASGTSGEKAAMNGVMHFSVLDGWWVEGYKPGAGWALQMDRTYDNQDFQDELDSATIYNMIENEIAQIFYKRDEYNEYSREWIQYVKNCIAQVACNFTTNRMMTDYINKYYLPLEKRNNEVSANNYALAREIAQWKTDMYNKWHKLDIRSIVTKSENEGEIFLGQNLTSEAIIYVGDIKPSELGVEIVIAEENKKGTLTIKDTYQFEAIECNEGVARYRAQISPEYAGAYHYAVRVYAKNDKMVYREDLPLVRWV